MDQKTSELNTNGCENPSDAEKEPSTIRIVFMNFGRSHLEIPYKTDMTFEDMVNDVDLLNSVTICATPKIICITFTQNGMNRQIVIDTKDNVAMSLKVNPCQAGIYKMYVSESRSNDLSSNAQNCSTMAASSVVQNPPLIQNQKSQAYMWMQCLKILNYKMSPTNRFWASLSTMPHIFQPQGCIYEFCKELTPNDQLHDDMHFVLHAFRPVKCLAFNETTDSLELCVPDVGHCSMNVETYHYFSMRTNSGIDSVNFLIKETEPFEQDFAVEKVSIAFNCALAAKH